MSLLKRIVVIGATSGIGKCLAEHYARTNARIAIVGRREEKLREIAASAGDKFLPKACDVTDTDALPSVLDALCAELGGIDLMIVCAGAGDENPRLSYQIENRL